MESIFKRVILHWKNIGWLPPLHTLDHHITHIAGGAFVVLIFYSFGCPWLTAAIISSSIFFTVEFSTALVRGNWTDSSFDFVQYQFHWPFYFASVGLWWVFGLLLALILVTYVVMLLNDF